MYLESARIRKSYKLKEQKLDPDLCKIAQKWANHMAYKNYMYHGGGEQIIASGYKTVTHCFRGWMNSPPHRNWVLTRRSKCGFAYAQSSSGICYWVGVYR